MTLEKTGSSYHTIIEMLNGTDYNIIENNITDLAQLKHFDSAGYQYDADLSQGNDWVFTRKQES